MYLDAQVQMPNTILDQMPSHSTNANTEQAVQD